MTDDEKYKVIALLETGQRPTEISEDTGISYSAILKLKREYETSVVDGTVDSLFNVDKLLLSRIQDELSDVVDVSEQVSELTNGIAGLERLSSDLQSTASDINLRLQKMLLSVTELSQLDYATEILCKLQTAFVNKAVTQVNIQQNYGEPKYNEFLSDQPKSNT